MRSTISFNPNTRTVCGLIGHWRQQRPAQNVHRPTFNGERWETKKAEDWHFEKLDIAKIGYRVGPF